MAIDVTKFQWGPNNAYAYDPTSQTYYQGSYPGSEGNQGNLWGSFNADGTAALSPGATQWLPNVGGWSGTTGVNYGDFQNIGSLSPERQRLFDPGGLFTSFKNAPTGVQVTQAPEESFLSSFLQGPGFVGGAALGANALFGGGLGGLGNLFGGGGGNGMSLFDSLTNGISNFFGGGGNMIPATEWPATNLWSGGAGGGVGDIVWDGGLGSGATIPATQWPANMWTGQTPGSNPMVSWDGAAPVPFNSSTLSNLSNAGNAVKSIFGGNGSLLGAGLGALLGGMGANQKPAGTTTSIQDIPDYLKPYQSMNLASGLSNMQQASSGAQLLPGSQQYMQDQIAGKYLDPNTNPAFQPYVKDLMGQAGANYIGTFGKNPDNLNNSGFQEGYGRAITNAVLPLYNQAFQTAQGNQYNAAANAPQYAGNVAGAALAPNLAFKNLYTGPQANTQPYFSNPMGGALAGGLAGYNINNLFGSKQ